MTLDFIRRGTALQPSPDPDIASAQTVACMVRLIKDAARSPELQHEAELAIEQFRGGAHWMAAGVDPLTDPVSRVDRERAMAESFWWWSKHNLKFVHHTELASIWLQRPDLLQLLIAPDVIVSALNGDDSDARDRARNGDCAIYTPCIAAMCEAVGLDWELCIAAVDPETPTIFGHVWPRVIFSDGSRESLDASHGRCPGWQVPERDIYRRQVWSSSGRLVSEDSGGGFSGLHGYIARGWGQTDDGIDLSSIYQAPSDAYSGPGTLTDVVVTPGTTYNVPSTPSGSGGNFLQALTQQGLNLVGRIVAPQATYVRGPNGQLYITSPAAPGGQPVNPFATLPSVGGGSTLLIAGGLGLLVLIGIMAMGKK